MTEPLPAWKFWGRVPFWQVLLIFLVAQLIATFALVALRELAGLSIPEWIAGGVGGLLGVVAVQALARRHRPK
jgi:hypothetical protein